MTLAQASRTRLSGGTKKTGRYMALVAARQSAVHLMTDGMQVSGMIVTVR